MGLDIENILSKMLFIGDNLIILYTNANYEDSFPKGYCFNAFTVRTSSFSVGKTRFSAQWKSLGGCDLCMASVKSIFYSIIAMNNKGVLEQPFYEWCSLYIKNID